MLCKTQLPRWCIFKFLMNPSKADFLLLSCQCLLLCDNTGPDWEEMRRFKNIYVCSAGSGISYDSVWLLWSIWSSPFSCDIHPWRTKDTIARPTTHMMVLVSAFSFAYSFETNLILFHLYSNQSQLGSKRKSGKCQWRSILNFFSIQYPKILISPESQLFTGFKIHRVIPDVFLWVL